MNLREYLDSSGTSQAELAKRLGVTQGLIWQWLHGRRQIAAESGITYEQPPAGPVSRHDLRPDIYPRESPILEQRA